MRNLHKITRKLTPQEYAAIWYAESGSGNYINIRRLFIRDGRLWDTLGPRNNPERIVLETWWFDDILPQWRKAGSPKFDLSKLAHK